MEERKSWGELTENEITKIKVNQCIHCKYFGTGSNYSITHLPGHSCMYALIAEEKGLKPLTRRCDPRDCVEKGFFLPKRRKKKKVE